MCEPFSCQCVGGGGRGGTDIPRDWIKPEFLTLWSPEVVVMMGGPTPDAQNHNLWKSGPHAEVTVDLYLEPLFAPHIGTDILL